MIDHTKQTITTAEAVTQLIEVVADLIQHQRQTALAVKALIEKVQELEAKANGQ
jgi:hypothetical protein